MLDTERSELKSAATHKILRHHTLIHVPCMQSASSAAAAPSSCPALGDPGRDGVTARAAPWVDQLDDPCIERAVRCLSVKSDRLLFVRHRNNGMDRLECDVLGSSGNLYTVAIASLVSCTCPDFRLRPYTCKHPERGSSESSPPCVAYAGLQCKHSFYVKLNVRCLQRDDPMLRQRAYLAAELATMLASVAQARSIAQAAPAVVLAALSATSSSSSATHTEVSGDCPICYCLLAGGDALTYCAAQCNHQYHRDCILGYSKFCSKSKKEMRCSVCRAIWVSESAAKAGMTSVKAGKMKYMNATSLTGQKRARYEKKAYRVVQLSFNFPHISAVPTEPENT